MRPFGHRRVRNARISEHILALIQRVMHGQHTARTDARFHQHHRMAESSQDAVAHRKDVLA